MNTAASRYPMLPDLDVGPDVLGPNSTVPTAPIASLDSPEMTPPPLETFAYAPAPAVMDWWTGARDMPGFSAGWFQTRELTMYYVEGPDNGPPLLLFPGQTEPWHSYDPSIPKLADHFHLYILELRGHGFSERSRSGAYRVIDYVKDAVEFTEHVIGEPAIVSGHSLGGMMVMAMWDNYPQWMRGASVEDAPFFVMDKNRYPGSWLETLLFGPRRTPARAFHEGRASLVAATRHMAGTPMILPPADILPRKEDRQYFVDHVMTTTPIKAIFSMMRADDRNHYEQAWESYVETGAAGLRGDFLPFPLMEPMREPWEKTDWRTSLSHITSEWIDDFDERRALKTMSVPTLFWIADKVLVPLHTDKDHEEAERLVQTIDRPVRCIEAKGSAHHIHQQKPDLFTSEMIKMFATA